MALTCPGPRFSVARVKLVLRCAERKFVLAVLVGQRRISSISSIRSLGSWYPISIRFLAYLEVNSSNSSGPRRKPHLPTTLTKVLDEVLQVLLVMLCKLCKVNRRCYQQRSVSAGAKIDHITPRQRGDAAE
jgi:hypothetical protein